MIPDAEIAAILRSVNRGDEAAFTMIYDAYADRVFRFLITLTEGREDTARDVLQETMIRVATRRLPEAASERDWWNWLARVARNQWIDLLRREQRRHRRTSALPPAASREAIDIEAERHEWLEEAMTALPADDRALIEERYFFNKRVGQLAEEWRLSYKSIESRLARIRTRLRKAVRRRMSDET